MMVVETMKVVGTAYPSHCIHLYIPILYQFYNICAKKTHLSLSFSKGMR